MSLARRLPPDDPSRRGWCPSLARPMPTGDGLLARVHPPLGVLSAAQLSAVASAARRFGNGHVDVTARGNLQIRGVSAATAHGVAACLADAGLADIRADGGPQRLTLTSPLAGLDPSERLDVPALARAVEAVGLTVAGLPAKTLVAIDGGGRWGLGAAEADVFVVAAGTSRVAIGLASEAAACPWTEVAFEDAPAALGRVLSAFVATGRRRVRDLDASARGQVMAAMAAPSCSAPARNAERVSADPPRPGVTALPSGLAAIVTEAPFGRCTAAGLDAVAALVRDHAPFDGAGALPGGSGARREPERCHADPRASSRSSGSPARPRTDEGEGEGRHGRSDSGRGGIRLTPARGLVLLVPQAQADAALAALAALGAAGFVTDPADPRRAVAACPGAPACASGTTPVPEHAARLAEGFASFAARGFTAHVSGCAKGCAHPRRAALTLVAEDGLYRVLVDGAPGDGGGAPGLTFEAALDRVRRADPAEPLAGVFRS